MQWHRDNRKSVHRKRAEWKIWFAWHPVYFSEAEKYIWLEFIERRKFWVTLWSEGWWASEYKEINPSEWE